MLNLTVGLRTAARGERIRRPSGILMIGFSVRYPRLFSALLGVEAYKQKYGAAGAPNQHVSTDNPLYFQQTGHTIGGKFREYWESRGGLAQQGYPISNEFTEVSALDGNPYTVQYFQRAEFEYHPENQPPNDVLLSQLGTFKARQLGAQQP